jgi:hypothetical protein
MTAVLRGGRYFLLSLETLVMLSFSPVLIIMADLNGMNDFGT